MYSGGRKYVFVYSVQHTGTWFLIRFLRTVNTLNKSKQCGDQWFRKHTERDINIDNLYIPNKPILESFAIKHGERYIDKNILKNTELLIIHGHHNRQGGNFYTALKNHKPKLPILIPIRDPLLSINSKLWREYRTWNEINKWETKEDRIARAKQFADSMLDMLNIPNNHVYMLPIDIKYTKKQKINIGKSIFDFCSLNFTDNSKEYILNWEKQNNTISKIKNLDNFLEIKTAYKEKNMKILEKYLGYEIETLQKQQNLIKLFKEKGYEQLPWIE